MEVSRVWKELPRLFFGGRVHGVCSVCGVAAYHFWMDLPVDFDARDEGGS